MSQAIEQNDWTIHWRLSESAAHAIFVRAGRIATPEAIKDVWQIRRGNALPGIADNKPDTAGNTQPTARDPDRRTYMINHLVPVEVTVK